MLTFTDDRHPVDEHVLYAGGIPVWIIKPRIIFYRLWVKDGSICEIAGYEAATSARVLPIYFLSSLFLNSMNIMPSGPAK